MAGAAVCWKSRRQVTVAASTVEVEYMAIGDATKEALWLRSLFFELNIQDLNYPTRILVDNEGSVSLAKNPLLSDCSKHIDIQHHFIQEQVFSHEIYLSYCHTSDMVADILTKALEWIKHYHFVYLLGLWGGPVD